MTEDCSSSHLELMKKCFEKKKIARAAFILGSSVWIKLVAWRDFGLQEMRARVGRQSSQLVSVCETCHQFSDLLCLHGVGFCSGEHFLIWFCFRLLIRWKKREEKKQKTFELFFLTYLSKLWRNSKPMASNVLQPTEIARPHSVRQGFIIHLRMRSN